MGYFIWEGFYMEESTLMGRNFPLKRKPDFPALFKEGQKLN